MQKKIIVVHSGGMDSSICLAHALTTFKASEVLSLGFIYGQRHEVELSAARKISNHFQVDRIELEIPFLNQITQSALLNKDQEITQSPNQVANTLVVGRNGLMARIAAIHANSLGAQFISMGVIEVESENSGYPDCSRAYMDKMQDILRLDLNNSQFEILTPIVKMTKNETMMLAFNLGILEFLLENTITCYEGIIKYGCGKCPACCLRNRGLAQFLKVNPDISFSYKDKILKEWV
jgi:7-cyano-7-deazaguanine synthase